MNVKKKIHFFSRDQKITKENTNKSLAQCVIHSENFETSSELFKLYYASGYQLQRFLTHKWKMYNFKGSL